MNAFNVAVEWAVLPFRIPDSNLDPETGFSLIPGKYWSITWCYVAVNIFWIRYSLIILTFCSVEFKLL
jgi:hypothetical protein